MHQEVREKEAELAATCILFTESQKSSEYSFVLLRHVELFLHAPHAGDSYDCCYQQHETQFCLFFPFSNTCRKRLV